MPIKGQMDARLSEPLPVEQVPKLDISYITPNCSQAVVNLQMDYLMNKKSILTRWLFGSQFTLSLITAWIGTVIYWGVGDYFSSYTFKNGALDGLKQLFGNSFFRAGLIEVTGLIALGFAVVWTVLFETTAWLKDQCMKVPDEQKELFGLDMSEYASLTGKKKFSAEEKKQIEFMKKNSVHIVYRETPIAFIVKQIVVDTEESIEYKVTALGIRRVYVSAGVLEDLLTYLIRDLHEVNGRNAKCSLDLYNFETFDQDIAKSLGFKLEKEVKTNQNWLLRNIFRVTLRTYSYEVTQE
ncbi:DEKNAAC101697 [Brettanomyces naardenensis]|uniref:DEKNAAC101697 n=1 Tax=Brettanomyces naardenensis TaxID=13370 RepID=A0A448YIS0_BRENA|nr:DEKNAAC101697 [Brettanomyces naardenensis]